MMYLIGLNNNLGKPIFKYLLLFCISACAYLNTGVANAQSILTETQIQQVSDSKTVDVLDRQAFDALTKVLRELKKSGVDIRGVITTRDIDGKTSVSVVGCAGALWGRAIRIANIHEQRARLDDSAVEKRNILIDKEDVERRDLIRSMKAQALYNDNGEAQSSIDRECSQTSSFINSIFDDLYVVTKKEYDIRKSELESAAREKQLLSVTRAPASIADQNVNAQSTDKSAANTGISSSEKTIDSPKPANVNNQALVQNHVPNSPSTASTKSSPTGKAFSAQLEDIFIMLLATMVVGVLLAVPIALVLRWQAKVVILENLTDAGVMFLTSVIFVISFLVIASNTNILWKLVVGILYSICCWWSFKVSGRSNVGLFQVAIVSLARIGMSCFLLIFLAAGKNGINAQKSTESDLQYMIRYSQDAEAEERRRKNQTILGVIFAVFSALAINSFTLESLSAYFSRRSRFIEKDEAV